jgi:hypothetical protein
MGARGMQGRWRDDASHCHDRQIAFQPDTFQGQSERSRLRRFRDNFTAFVLPAGGVPRLEETAWQRGKRETSELARGRAIVFMLICAPLFAVGSLFVPGTGLGFLLRAVVAAVVGLAVAVVAAATVAVVLGFRALVKQRDEAREYAEALVQHAREYKRWARRREIAEDHRREATPLLGVEARANRPGRNAHGTKVGEMK